MARQPASDMSRLPEATPRFAARVCTAITERALPWPLAAGISAARHSRVAEARAEMNGLAKVRAAMLFGFDSSAGAVFGGISSPMRWSCSGPVPMWKSAPKGSANSRRKNSPRLTPVTRRTTSPMRWPWVRAW